MNIFTAFSFEYKFVSKIITQNLKKRVLSIKEYSDKEGYKSFIVLTNAGFLEIHASADEDKIKVEKEVIELGLANQLPLPKIVYYNQVSFSDHKFWVIALSIKGKPLLNQKIHIFDYNKILTSYAQALINLHKISPAKWGYLKPGLTGSKNSWNDFIKQDINTHCDYLHQSKIIDRKIASKIIKLLDFNFTPPLCSLLHGHLSSNIAYIDDQFNISTISHFIQPTGGDPNYDLAGFLVYEGFDRARRLINSYYLLGGNVEVNSDFLLRNALKRSLLNLYWAIKDKSGDSFHRKEILLEILSKCTC